MHESARRRVRTERILRDAITGDEFMLTATASGLGIDVVAECVQTVREYEALRTVGCRFAQGYYFARPLAPDDAAQALTGRACLRPRSADRNRPG
jgi:predicted signal transduction protein with EAL and GGDEF domain